MDPEELRKIQEEKFLKQLDYVWERSPFYQRKFKEHGIERGDIKGLEDLPKLPFTEKDELRKSQEDYPPLGSHAAASMEDVIRIHSSSGTTGVPTFIGITRHDHQVWTEITARSFFTEGIRKSDIVIHAAGLTFFVGGLPCKDAIEYIGATFVPIGTGASDRVVMTAKRLGANVLHCTPSYALYLAEYVRKKYNMDPAELGFRKLVLGAEPGGGIPSVRKRIEEEYQCRVTEGLGNSDAAPIIFGECPYQQGMHFCAQEYIFCELIDPDTGEVIEMKDGVEGELVYTLIDRECCPLIRFRTRDRVIVWTSSCECGRTSFRVRCIGRTDDMLIVLGVNVFPSAVKDVIMSFRPRTTGEMVILLDKPGPKVDPPVRIQVEYAQGVEDLQGLKKEIEQALREKLVFRSDVELVPEGTLPRYEMKAKLIRKLYEE
ncbi:MAG TPA: phenylacetate--CoA ligase family protein [Deltaproteobacteria bacterium]|nr:MAG: phenylacetate--CoA ligase family protein [Candidatus Latescibacterota bacterium]HEX15961.1 phenylacetate--CoA ligase family protein [Deltaproteobacteria bacterium]